MHEDVVPTEWLRAVLPLAVLAVVAEDLLTSSWREGVGGPGRTSFAATPAGRHSLHRRSAAWHTFTERAGDLLPDPRSTR